MGYPQSPGVNFSEIDNTTSVPGTSSTVAAYAGNFAWGPVDQLMLIDSQVTLVSRVLAPDANTFPDFFTCSNFLDYSDSLMLVRASANTCVNATSNGNGVLIKNQELYSENFTNGANTYGQFVAKYPGSKGNALKVSTFSSANNTAFKLWPYNGYFQGVPGTTTSCAAVNGANDEMHIVVIDSTGDFTGAANTVLETFGYVSKGSDANKDDGTSDYYKDVLYSQSNYIYWASHPAASNNWGTTCVNTNFSSSDAVNYTLSGGVYAQPTDGDILNSYGKFASQESVAIDLILMGDNSPTVASTVISTIAEVRKDAVVFVSPLRSDVVNNAGNEGQAAVVTKQTLPSSSYYLMDSGWKLQYDKYNNVNRYVPLNGDIAGLTAATDLSRDPWWSPAGFNRGGIKNVIKLAWNPVKADRDLLYKNSINPVVTFPGDGTVLYGDKTGLAKPSAFDRINVRRLFITLEQSISRASRYSLFELNDDTTRAAFVALVEPFLRDVKGRRGITSFKVVCDTTNNTPYVIDNNQFVGDIYISPARSINNIQLNFIATATGVIFNESVLPAGQ